VSEAIFGLIGVVIGGALNLIALWYLDLRRDRRGTQTAAASNPDPQECQTALWFALGYSAWSGVVVPDTRWKEQEERLARGMNADHWSTVSETFTSIEIVDNETGVPRPPTAMFTAEDKAFIEETHERIPAALDVLRLYAGLKKRHINVKRRP
jgi:hypothetical protein